MAEDKKTIGLTESNKVVMDHLVEQLGFKRDMDAAKFALALAVNRGHEPSTLEGVGTIWNVGSFDEAGELKALMANLFPQIDAPYRAVESLVNTGFTLLATEMKEKPNLRIEDVLNQASALT